MDIPVPSVVTTLKKDDYNFEFRVIAYRHLSKQEMTMILKRWLRQTGLKTIPKNKSITYQTLIGLDD